jgi:uncharacterized protein (TIRG00374 family)
MKISKHLFTRALMIIFAIGVFVYIGVETNWVETWKAVKSANYLYILLAIILMTTAHYLRGARWDQLSRAAGYPINHRRAFYSVMSGYLVNVATSRGGEVVRCALTAKSEKAPIETLVGTVITERIIDLVIMLFMAALALMLQFDVLYQFAEPYVMTQGGPLNSTLSIVQYMYQEGFRWWNMGYSASIAFVLFFIIFIGTLIQFKVQKSGE